MGETTLVTKDNMTGTGRKHVVIEVSHKTPLVVHDDDQTISHFEETPCDQKKDANDFTTAKNSVVKGFMMMTRQFMMTLIKENKVALKFVLSLIEL